MLNNSIDRAPYRVRFTSKIFVKVPAYTVLFVKKKN